MHQSQEAPQLVARAHMFVALARCRDCEPCGVRCIDTSPVLPECDGGCTGVQALREAGQGGALVRLRERVHEHVHWLKDNTSQQLRTYAAFAAQRAHGSSNSSGASPSSNGTGVTAGGEHSREQSTAGMTLFEGRQPGSLAVVDEAEAENPAADVEGRVQTVVRAASFYSCLFGRPKST
jgi:hypothetical protein